ncbi:MAG: MYXO-CTERM sorting domain-containing protein, partial [bacterium]|nr:MYXO-CTERM sorting domain-containing protein [bacterium]
TGPTASGFTGGLGGGDAGVGCGCATEGEGAPRIGLLVLVGLGAFRRRRRPGPRPGAAPGGQEWAGLHPLVPLTARLRPKRGICAYPDC